MANTNFYRGNLRAADVISAATVALTQGEYTKIGEVTVEADQLIGMGYGAGEDQDNAAGRIYVDLKDSSDAAINGKFRIQMMSSQDMPISAKPVILDVDLAVLASGSDSRDAQIPWPFQNIFLSKDKKFVFYVKCDDASKTLTKANCTVNIDITQQLV